MKAILNNDQGTILKIERGDLGHVRTVNFRRFFNVKTQKCFEKMLNRTIFISTVSVPKLKRIIGLKNLRFFVLKVSLEDGKKTFPKAVGKKDLKNELGLIRRDTRHSDS